MVIVTVCGSYLVCKCYYIWIYILSLWTWVEWILLQCGLKLAGFRFMKYRLLLSLFTWAWKSINWEWSRSDNRNNQIWRVYIYFRNVIIKKPCFWHFSPSLDFFLNAYIDSDGRIKLPVVVFCSWLLQLLPVIVYVWSCKWAQCHCLLQFILYKLLQIRLFCYSCWWYICSLEMKMSTKNHCNVSDFRFDHQSRNPHSVRSLTWNACTNVQMWRAFTKKMDQLIHDIWEK